MNDNEIITKIVKRRSTPVALLFSISTCLIDLSILFFLVKVSAIIVRVNREIPYFLNI
jgi:hypothetical protein